jgi:hypothetical protein
MQRAVQDAPFGGGVESAGKGPGPRQEVGQGSGTELLQRDVERVAFGERGGQEWGVRVDAGIEQPDGRGQRRGAGDQLDEGIDHGGHPFGRQVDREELDGDSGARFGIDRTENRAARARTDLMEDTEAADGRRWDVEQRAFPGHVLT